MNTAIGFDNERYLAEQTAAIQERIDSLGHKLYLEFGGKLLFDYHASRVLPGFDPNVKMRLLQKFRDRCEIVLCIHAGDIAKRKLRADFGITYDVDALKLIDDLREWDLEVGAVVITRFEEQPAAEVFKNGLERRGVRVYLHRRTKGYPTDVDLIVSDKGYGANEYVETEKPLVIVTAPGPGSGKLGTCLSQVYHDHQRGVTAGYAKFETFPIWNLPLRHPVNVAYEAATADIRDFNMIDPFHLDAYGESAVNYNRDVDAFPVVSRILKRILGEAASYKSPTDMGVNRAGFAIVNDDAVKLAAEQEIVRRYFRYACEYAMGYADRHAVERTQLLMQELGLVETDRAVVEPARRAAREAEEARKGNQGVYCGAALVLRDGSMITGKNSGLLHATSGLILNAIKHLAGLPDEIHLLSPTVIDAIRSMKDEVLGAKTVSLHLDEALIALSICGATNPMAHAALSKLRELRGCEVHLTHMPSSGDEVGLRKLGVNLTSDPSFASKSLSRI